ncbi:MAG: hypothetical protein GY731_09320 [Gammaproteobacteria bacterium]|nr:hypothetical protein [Gammaproteobacteria bacterium]
MKRYVNIDHVYTLKKDFSVDRQSLADKRREMIPALRYPYPETYTPEEKGSGVILNFEVAGGR